MLIEAFAPLRVRVTSGEVRLRPGQPVWLDDADALTLLARGKVRWVNPPAASPRPIREGDLVEWRSPLFSNSQAEVLEVDDQGKHFLVHHPGTDKWVWLPTAWIVRTVKE
ncbi:MAG: hypothetical protein H0V35_07135 [Nitrospira sp.]|nr:hypothetical protein [Nitrospira sp.]